MGIMLGLVADYWSNPVLKNCVVSDNILIRGTGVDNQSGIVVNGEFDATHLYMAENIVITNNSVTGFGGSSSSTVGAITLYNVKNVVVENNTIDDFAQSGITLYYNVWNARILNNFIQDCRGGASPTITAGIQFNSTGLINIIVDGNTLNARTVAKAPQYFLRSTTAEGISSQIGTRNRILYTASGVFYSNTATLPVNKAASPTYPTSDYLMAVGGVVNDTTYKPGWVCSAVGSGVLGYGSTDTTTSLVLATATAGSSIVTVADSTRNYRAIAPGTAIVIAGAGTAGADLNCLVIDNDKTTITISTPIVTSVTSAVVKYQGVTFTAY
jgi:hypothetical protein